MPPVIGTCHFLLLYNLLSSLVWLAIQLALPACINCDVQSRLCSVRTSNQQLRLLQSVMVDPVIAADGRTYERRAMEEWLQHHHTSPVTADQLQHTRLVPNVVARAAMSHQQLKDIMAGSVSLGVTQPAFQPSACDSICSDEMLSINLID